MRARDLADGWIAAEHIGQSAQRDLNLNYQLRCSWQRFRQ